MKYINKNIELKLGNHIKIALVFSKQKCSLQSVISLCGLGKSNNINLQLSLSTFNLISSLNFGDNLHPTFNRNFEFFNEGTSDEHIKISDVYNNIEYFYITYLNPRTYYSYISDSKLKFNSSSNSYTFFVDENNETLLSPTGNLENNSFIITKYKDNKRYYLNTDGIYSFDDQNLSSERVIFNKNSQTNIIESIDIYSTSFSTDSDAKKDRIIFTYYNNKISKITFLYIDGTKDTYVFSLNSDQWKISHEESKKALFFNFDNNGNVISFKEDFDFYERNEFYNVITLDSNHTVVEYTNNDFIYLHFDKNNNFDYMFNSKGILKCYEYINFKNDYLLLRESNGFYLNRNYCKYENLTPFSSIAFSNKWSFIKGNSLSSCTYSLINTTPYFSIFNLDTTATISTVSDDLSSKLCAEIEGDFSNKKFVFLSLINAINSGTAGFLKVKFTPYFNGNLINKYLERQINLNNSEGYKFICEGVEFECDVDKIQIEIIFYGGQNLKMSNLMFFEHEYGKYVFYNQNKLVYKIKNNNELIRYKRYDFDIKGIEVKNASIFLEEEETDGDNFVTKSLISNYFTNKVTSNLKNQVLKEEKIYDYLGKKEILLKEFAYNDNGLISKERDCNLVESNFEYFSNTSFCSSVKTFNVEQKFTTGDKTISSWFLEENTTQPQAYKTVSTFNDNGSLLSTKEEERGLYNFSYDNLNILLNASLNNLSLEENEYEESTNYVSILLNKKTLNNYSYFFEYDTNDNIKNILGSSSEILFNFTYDYLDNITKVTDNSLNESSFKYDGDNNLIEEKTSTYTLKNIIQNNSFDRKEYYNENQKILDTYTLACENAKSEIITNILSKLADTNRYVCFFDRTNTYLKTNNDSYDYVQRYCQLIRNYYSQNDFLPVRFIDDNNSLYLRINPKNINSADIFVKNPIYYSKTIYNQYSKISGSFGFAFKSLISSDFSVAAIDVGTIFKISFISTVNSGSVKTFKIQVLNKLTNQSNLFDTLIVCENAKQYYFNINFMITNSRININLFTNVRTVNYSVNISSSLGLSNEIKYIINEDISDASSSSYLKISAVLADFGSNIPLDEVITFFNLVARALKIDELFDENDFYISQKNLTLNYNSLSSNYKYITFNNNAADNEGNLPINYLGNINSIVFDKTLKRNCYYAYSTPLLYKTILSDVGTLSFKARCASLEGENQDIFTLYNDGLYIKFFINSSGKLFLSFNGSNQELYNNFSVLNEEFKIVFSYRIVNNSLNFYFRLNEFSSINATLTNVNAIFETGSKLNLLFGENYLSQDIQDINGNVEKLSRNKFNGFISDFVCINQYQDNQIISEINSFLNPIQSISSKDVFERNFDETLRYNNKDIIYKKYIYKNLTNDLVTPLLEEEKIYFNAENITETSLIDRKYTYSYIHPNDDKQDYKNVYEYVEAINQDLLDAQYFYIHQYEYDSITNYLKKETIIKSDSFNGTSYNILEKKEYEYTYSNSNISNIKYKLNDTQVETKTFSYDANTNRLTYANNKSFVYDGLYLKQIKNLYGQTEIDFGYRGTKLTSYVDHVNNVNLNFVYDYKGKRTEKNNLNTNESVKYFYDGNNLVLETHNNYSIAYLYQDNMLKGFKHIKSDGSYNIYFYVRNSFRDIVEILDEHGNSLVHYLYDAFGNILEIVDNSNDNIGSINPYRYRGYYLDIETNFFILGGRYYSSKLCRFIQPDTIEYLNTNSVNGLNIYCYCSNNPIMFIDPTGHKNEWVMLLVGFLFLAASIIATFATGGAAAGTIAYSIHSIASAASICGIAGAIFGVIGNCISVKNGTITWDWSGAEEAFMWGAITGVLCGVAGATFISVGKGFSTLGNGGKLLYLLIQGSFNAGVAGLLEITEGIFTNDLTLENVLISMLFGAFGGVIDIKTGNIIKVFIIEMSLELGKTIIEEIFAFFKNKEQTNYLNLRFMY